MKKKLLYLTALSFLTIGLTGFIKNLIVIPESKKSFSITTPIAKENLIPTTEKRNKAAKSKPFENFSQQEILKNLSELPLVFEKNMGQWRPEVLYKASAGGTQVGFRKEGLTFFSSRESEEHDEDDPEEEDNSESEEAEELYEYLTWNLSFKGMSNQVQIVAEGEVPGTNSYLKGNDPNKWIKNAPQSKLIKYKGIYPNIDLHYYGLGNRKLEYDYIVKPGGNMASIQMELDGAGELKINGSGELIITTPWGEVAEAKPFSYQVINGVKKVIDIRYDIIDEQTFGFKAYENYNTAYDLIIDPKQLVWSTYVDGEATGGVYYVYDMGIDAAGNSYMTGMTENNFDITPGVVQATFGGGATDAFVFKINRFGRQLVYCTYVGGSADDRGFGIAVSSAGNAYITGQTASTNHPTAGAAMSTANSGGLDIFVSALNAAGNAFIYSTYCGSSSDDRGEHLVVNASNEAFVTGYASKNGFPTTAGVVRTAASSSGGRDAFVLKLTATGANSFCTLLGANSITEQGHGIAVSATNEIYVTGITGGNSFPSGGYDNTHNGANDAFVVKLNATATTLLYSTLLGGTGEDVAWGISERNGEAYVVGVTVGGFPTTAGAVRTTYAGGNFDLFVTKLNTLGTGLVYSTYLGGSLEEYGAVGDWNGSDIVVNENGEAYVSYTTLSTNNPAVNGYDLTANTNDDAFIALIAANGQSILCSTYLGGTANDYKKISIALDRSGPQDTLYGTLTTHSRSPFDATPGTLPIAQTQGTVYSNDHFDDGGGDEPYIFKMYSCMIPLPVELISFIGKNNGEYNFLEWSTASETNNDYFTIERSLDGISFHKIGSVKGAGDSQQLLRYSYSDPANENQLVYYRLNQTDLDGTSSLSKTIAVNAAMPGKNLDLKITSPVTQHLTYKVCCLKKGISTIEVLDLSGNKLLSEEVQVKEGYNTLSLDVKSLSEGAYLLKFTSENSSITTKFIK